MFKRLKGLFRKQTAKDEPVWIVNSLGELGVFVNGRYFFLYKGHSLEYGNDEKDIYFRVVGKREFGEVCHPIDYPKSFDFNADQPYMRDLLYDPKLSYGEKVEWELMPQRKAT